VCRRSYPGFISAICESRNVRGLLYDFAWIESASHPFISFAKRELDACRTRHELFLCRPLRTRLSPTSAHIFEKNTTSTSRETCTMYFLSGFSHSTLIFADGNFLHNHLTDASVTIGILRNGTSAVRPRFVPGWRRHCRRTLASSSPVKGYGSRLFDYCSQQLE
jgi:hypothetical protein